MIYTHLIWLILGRTCGAVWTFERYIDYELEGFVRDVQTEISKTECEDLCLSESRWSFVGFNFFLLKMTLKVFSSKTLGYLNFVVEGSLVDLLLTTIWRGSVDWARKTGGNWKKRNRVFSGLNILLLWILLTHTSVQIQSTGSIQGETGIRLPGKPVWIT